MKLNGLIRFKALALAVTFSTQALGYDVSKSVDRAYVTSLGKVYSIESIPKNLPIVIYLHGSAGINDHTRSWAMWISQQGYTVIAPDSMAIPGRTRNSSKHHVRNLNKIKGGATRLRKREVEELVSRLRTQGLLDLATVIMGHSEGGAAVTRLHLGNFDSMGWQPRGVISSGYDCFTAVLLPNTIPILNIKHLDDPWFKDRTASCATEPTFLDNPSHAVTLPGRGHTTFHSPQSREAVRNFLEAASR